MILVRKIFQSLLIVLLTVSTVSAKTYSLRLKWFHQYQFAGFYAAEKMGYYKDAGLDIKIEERDPKTSPMEDVLSGRNDFGISDSSLIKHRLNGDPVVVLAVIFQRSPMVLMSLAKNNIKSPSDLIGKRIMYQRSVDDALLTAMFNELGLTEDDYTHVKHSFDNDALVKNYTDVMSAYITNQPYIYRQEKKIPVNIIDPLNYGIDFYGDMLFTSERMIKEHPEVVRAFREASLKGWEFALENPEVVIDWILTDYNSGKNKKTRGALAYEAQMTERMIKPTLIELGKTNASRFKRIAEIYKEKKLANANSNLDGFLYEEYKSTDDDNLYWLCVTLLVILCLSVITVSVIFVNKRLKFIIEKRTRVIEVTNQVLESINKELVNHNETLVEEQNAALDYYTNLVHIGCLDKYLIETMISPKGIWGGDMVLSAEDHNHNVHLLVADMTGHGLGAAIGLIPMATTFYHYIENNHDKETILERLNTIIRRYCPEGKFCAACYVVVNYEEQRLHYWNGGLPQPQFYSRKTNTLEELVSENVFLGALKTEKMSSEFHSEYYESGDMVFMFTDGILEGMNKEGQFYGMTKLKDVLLNYATSDDLLKEIIDDVHEFTGNYDQDDDVTFVSITLTNLCKPR